MTRTVSGMLVGMSLVATLSACDSDDMPADVELVWDSNVPFDVQTAELRHFDCPAGSVFELRLIEQQGNGLTLDMVNPTAGLHYLATDFTLEDEQATSAGDGFGVMWQRGRVLIDRSAITNLDVQVDWVATDGGSSRILVMATFADTGYLHLNTELVARHASGCPID